MTEHWLGMFNERVVQHQLCYEAGMGLEDIRRVMRHSQATTTQHYLDDMDTGALDRAAPLLD